MRVLLDECVPRALRKELPGHEVTTVAEAGWAGVRNGELLQLAAKQFDLLLTVDRNLEYQQNFAGLTLAVIVVHALSNDVTVLRPLMRSVLAAIPTTKPGMVTHIHA
jgi:predicted nuclease of predicted toxin-antitoxin system